MIINATVKKLVNDGSKVKANLTLNIGGVFAVRGVRLIDGKNGLFVSMPSRKNALDEYYDICYPLDSDTRSLIYTEVMDAYKTALQEQDSAESQ